MQVAIEQAVIIRSKTKAFYKGEAHPHTHTRSFTPTHSHRELCMEMTKCTRSAYNSLLDVFAACENKANVNFTATT